MQKHWMPVLKPRTRGLPGQLGSSAKSSMTGSYSRCRPYMRTVVAPMHSTTSSTIPYLHGTHRFKTALDFHAHVLHLPCSLYQHPLINSIALSPQRAGIVRGVLGNQKTDICPSMPMTLQDCTHAMWMSLPASLSVRAWDVQVVQGAHAQKGLKRSPWGRILTT